MAICLWYDNQAEEAAEFYSSIFKNSKIIRKSHFGKEGFEFHGKPEGTVMAVDFEINGMNFIAMNGGPNFKFNEAVSVVIYCDTQDEIDHYCKHLTENGEEALCGWLKDRFGVSWQITPTILPEYLMDTNMEKRNRVEKCAFGMMKFDIESLQRAYNGE
ncbi:MAG: VOC family protein [Bacteroidales bacterium]|nr:VOC family protein [Bacteroidales bacterium]